MYEMLLRGLKWSALAMLLLLLVLVVHKKMPGAPLNVPVSPDLRTHYLLDYEYLVDPAAGEATMGHLVVLNPGDLDATLDITVFFEEAEPRSFQMVAPARASTESNYEDWPVEEGHRFALQVESSIPVICQATIGWNNTSNDYDFGATTRSGQRPRETAKSYASLPGLAEHWYLADGYIIDKPGRTWLSESESLILLNPHEVDLSVRMTTYSHGSMDEKRLMVPARRVGRFSMDDLAPHNRHYGARFTAEQQFAAQWVRVIRWNESTELMTDWSVPLVPLEIARGGAGTSPVRDPSASADTDNH